jgi:octopamine receptor
MIYVYIQVYSAARKQVQAFRSGYKHHYAVQSSKSFIPKFSLNEISTGKRPKMKTTIEISDNNAPEKSTVLLKKRKSSFKLITLRIHHGKYQNPNLEPLNSNNQHNNKSIKKIRRKNVPTNKFWKKISEDQKAAKFVGIVMGVFVICWLPFFTYYVLSSVFKFRLKDERNHELLFKIFSWLGYTNSALDILVYIFTSKELRVTLFKLFCKS